MTVWLPLLLLTSTTPLSVDVVVLQKAPPQQLSIDAGRCQAPGVHGAVIEVTQATDGIRVCSHDGCVAQPATTLTCKQNIALRADQRQRRHYGRVLRVRHGAKGLRVVAQMPVEPYARAVVDDELSGAPAEAQKAQLVLTRTYALQAKQRPRHDDGDLCDLTHCQVYRGRHALGDDVQVGKVLADGDVLAEVYYHSTCGGHTVGADARWPGSSSTTVGVSDLDDKGQAFCKKSPHHRWSRHVSTAELQKVLQRLGQRQTAKRVHRQADEIVVQWASGQTWTTTTQAFHRAVGKTLGWHKLKSLDFDVKHTPSGFVFAGRGLGHAVGMCQHGAMERARRGQSADAILQAYFPKLQLRPIDDVDVAFDSKEDGA